MTTCEPNAQVKSDEFIEKYHPFHHKQTETGNPMLLETYGGDMLMVDLVRKIAPTHLWTLVDGDDGDLYVTAGCHFVNRLAYIITEEPWKIGDEQYLWE